jgi:hypothetical protein
VQRPAISAVNYAKPEAIQKRLMDVGGETLGVSKLDAYAESKMLLTLWTEELQGRLRAHASTKRESNRSTRLREWPSS